MRRKDKVYSGYPWENRRWREIHEKDVNRKWYIGGDQKASPEGEREGIWSQPFGLKIKGKKRKIQQVFARGSERDELRKQMEPKGQKGHLKGGASTTRKLPWTPPPGRIIRISRSKENQPRQTRYEKKILKKDQRKGPSRGRR